MAKRILVTGSSFLLLFFLFTPAIAETSDPDLLGVGYGAETGLSRSDPRVAVARIIQTLLQLLGTITLALIVYAGFLWVTSAGSEEKIEKAQGIIRAAVIGLIIIMSAYAVTTFVIGKLYFATSGYLFG